MRINRFIFLCFSLCALSSWAKTTVKKNEREPQNVPTFCLGPQGEKLRTTHQGLQTEGCPQILSFKLENSANILFYYLSEVHSGQGKGACEYFRVSNGTVTTLSCP